MSSYNNMIYICKVFYVNFYCFFNCFCFISVLRIIFYYKTFILNVFSLTYIIYYILYNFIVFLVQ